MSKPIEKSLFPPYLNLGSRGGAVDFLHQLLEAFGFGKDIVADLEYGKVTAARVADLQRSLDIEPDGNFGPNTRAAIYDKTGLNVNLIKWTTQDGLTDWMGPDGQIGVWPE